MDTPGESLAGLAGQLASAAGQLAAAVGQASTGEQPVSTGDRPAAAAEPDGGGGALRAVRRASDAHRLAAAVLQASVEQARAAGHTWQDLGDLLGVTRQAAFQRFGRPAGPGGAAPLPDAGPRATALLTDWIGARYERVTAQFGPVLTERLPPGRLADAWATVTGTVGRYDRMGEPLVRRAGPLTIVEIPLGFEAGEMLARVTFGVQGQVAGLFVLPPGTP